MAVDYFPSSRREQQFNDVLADYFAATEAGRTPDRQQLIDLYPELAADLRSFFVEQDRMASCAAPLRWVVQETLETSPIAHAHTPAETKPAGDGELLHSFGDYEVLAEIARGGMGVVYRARQRSLNRLVALKVLRTTASASSDDVRRLRGEAEAAAQLDHPHIVAVHEVGDHNGQPFLSMQLIDGGSLADHAQRMQKDVRLAAQLVAVAARAVHHAHERGILHRDLKPSNILLDRDGQPHITDFGLAKRIDADGDLTQSGTLVGTPHYMAPEQTLGKKGAITTASDIYGLGAVLYTVLTGRPPFHGQTLFDTLEQIKQQEPAPPSRTNPSVDKDLETICLKCLQKEPRERYPTAEHLAADLERYLNGEPIQARPMTGWERTFTWARRRPTVAALIGVSAVAFIAILAVAVGSFYHVQLRKERDEVDRQRSRAQEQQWLAQKHRLEAVHQRALARRYLYGAHMNLAHRQWQEAGVSRVLELLDQHRPKSVADEDLRGFEWYYLWRLCHSELRTLHKQIGTAALSPDGQRLASFSGDRAVRIWDIDTGRELLTLREFRATVLGMAFSANGRRLVSVSADQTVRIWDIISGREVLAFQADVNAVSHRSLSADGGRLASVGKDRTIAIWDTSTGQRVRTLKGQNHAVSSVILSRDGQRLALSCRDQTVRIWDSASGRELLVVKAPARVYGSMDFSPDGRRIALTGWDEKVRVWDVAANQELFTLKGHTEVIADVAFSADGRRLVSGGVDQTVRIWDAATGAALAVLKGNTAPVRSVAFSADGARIVSSSVDHAVRIWNAGAEPEFRTLKGHAGVVGAVVFSRDGKRLGSASSDHTVRIWDVATSREVVTIKGHTAAARSIAFSPDGRRLVSGGHDRTVRLWDAASGQELLRLTGHTDAVSTVAFSPDGKCIASGSRDHTIRIWDADTGRVLFVIEGGAYAVQSLAFSPDGNHLATAGGDIVCIRDAVNAQAILTLQGQTKRAESIAYSPDGRRIAAANYELVVRVWDAVTGRELLVLKGHTAPAQSVAFSPDGKRLASAGIDRTIRIWDAGTGQEILTLRGQGDQAHSVAFSRDGTLLASGNADGMVRIWAGSTAKEASGPVKYDPCSAQLDTKP